MHYVAQDWKTWMTSVVSRVYQWPWFGKAEGKNQEFAVNTENSKSGRERPFV